MSKSTNRKRRTPRTLRLIYVPDEIVYSDPFGGVNPWTKKHVKTAVTLLKQSRTLAEASAKIAFTLKRPVNPNGNLRHAFRRAGLESPFYYLGASLPQPAATSKVPTFAQHLAALRKAERAEDAWLRGVPGLDHEKLLRDAANATTAGDFDGLRRAVERAERAKAARSRMRRV